LAPKGTLVGEGTVVAWIEPPPARHKGQERAPLPRDVDDADPSRSVPQEPKRPEPSQDKRPVERPTQSSNGNGQHPKPAARRGSVAPVVEELTIEPRKVAPKAKATRETVKRRGLYVLRSQEKFIKKDVALWALDDDNPLTTNDSEIVRALLDLYQSLPPARRRALVEGYKEKERLAQIGGGWPRPGRPARKR
jgi:hypothetical protein